MGATPLEIADVAAEAATPETRSLSKPIEQAPIGRPEFTREVRLGVVLYGGVSLAIYINGVTQEFARAVRGQRGYRWIKALTDSDVVVDVVSGTSAGGINGLALGFALCNGYDLASLPRLWREQGDIASLLNAPDSNRPPINSLLNGTDYELKLKQAFIDMSETRYERESGSEAYISSTSEMDIYITGTYLDGFQWIEFDSRRHAIQVEDHRALFRLKYRALRESNPDLVPDAERSATDDPLFAALGKLARLTSTFPGAFPPVRIDKVGPAGGEMTTDGLLHRWGQLPSDVDGYFVDGGILDNKPFMSTLEAIFSRAATRDVNRLLLYVEPDPAEVIAPDGKGGKHGLSATEPNIAQTLLRARIDIPFVETMTDDLRQLADHNRGVQLYNRIASDLRGQWHRASEPDRRVETEPAKPQTPTEMVGAAMLDTYDRSRLVDLSQRIAQAVFNTRQRDRSPSQGPAENGSQATDTTLSERAEALIAYIDGQIAVSGMTTTWLLANDIFFMRRRVYHLIYLLHDTLYSGNRDLRRADDSEIDLQRKHLRAVLNRQAELYDILRSALGLLVETSPSDWQLAEPETLWNAVIGAGAQILDHAMTTLSPLDYRDLVHGSVDVAGDKAFSTAMSALNAEVRGFVRRLHRQPIETLARTSLDRDRLALIEELEEIEREAIEWTVGKGEPIWPTYTNSFRAFDAALFPLEVVGRLAEKDIVEIVRISAIDAQRGFSNRAFKEKLSGDGVMHFGGFFKRSWRANDILWGRLDGCCQLFECLLDKQRIEALLVSDAARTRVRERFFSSRDNDGEPPAGSNGKEPERPWRAGMDPRQLFPHSGAKVHEALEGWLRTLLEGPEETAKETLGRDHEVFLTMLVEAEQLELLYEEVPNVIGDALVEQEMWNRYQYAFPGVMPLPSLPPPEKVDLTQPLAPIGHSENGRNGKKLLRDWSFRATGYRKIDPFLAVTTAAEYVQGATDHVFHDLPADRPDRPTQTRMGAFFTGSYKVGGEQLTRDIPTVALLGIMARSLLVLRLCLLNLFGESAERVQHSPIYRYGLDLPLRAFYGFTVFWRRWSRAGAAVFVGTGILAIVLLAFGLGFWSSIIATEERFYLNRFLIFIAVPAIVLYFMAQVMILGPLLARWWRLSFLIVMTTAAVGLFAYGVWNFDEVWNGAGADRGWNLVIHFAGPALFFYLITRCVFWKIVDGLGAAMSRRREPRQRTG